MGDEVRRAAPSSRSARQMPPTPFSLSKVEGHGQNLRPSPPSTAITLDRDDVALNQGEPLPFRGGVGVGPRHGLHACGGAPPPAPPLKGRGEFISWHHAIDAPSTIERIPRHPGGPAFGHKDQGLRGSSSRWRWALAARFSRTRWAKHPVAPPAPTAEQLPMLLTPVPSFSVPVARAAQLSFSGVT